MNIVFLIKQHFRNRRAKKQFLAFKNTLLDLEKSFLYLKTIPDPDVTVFTYCDSIRTVEKYAEYVSRFDNLIPKISEHNNQILEIDEIVSSFSFKDIISHFDEVPPSFLNKLTLISTVILKYKSIGENYVRFVQEVRDLTDFKTIIYEQLKIKKECSLKYNQNFVEDSYIDENQVQTIKAFLEEANNRILKLKKVYFEIEELKYYTNQINDHNSKYISNQIQNDLFNDVGGRQLEEDQKRAIVTDSVSNLVIAGAGSGKTLTICGKAKWLLKEKRIPKNELLFLSYSRASTADLHEKLSKISDNLNVSTFHSLGLKIIETEKHEKQNVESNYDAIIERFFSEEMLIVHNIHTLRKVLEFYGQYAYKLEYEQFPTKGEQFESLKSSDFQTLKSATINVSNNKEEKETILKERVKSFEELSIANFYFLNGIKYRYEKPFPLDLATPEYRQYNPDFTLIEYDIYHEHFGIDKNGNCNQYSKEEAFKYIQSMRWKEQLHKQQKTKFIATYSYEFKDETIYDALEKKLTSFGVKLKPLSQEEVRNALESVYKNRNFKSIIKLVKSFLNLYKAKYIDNTHFDLLKSQPFENAYEKKRAILFLDICREIYDYYKNELNGKTDFDDMIHYAIKALPASDNFKYKYIMVDEFQDISYSRMEFLKALINHGNSKLFAVGDDWQSIYRFAGSDLGIFTNFDKYFKMTTESVLSKNYRNSILLHSIAESFITANPEQKKKKISCNIELDDPVQIVYYDVNKVSALNISLNDIYAKNPNANVLLLGRNNFDIDDFLSHKVRFINDFSIIHDDFKTMNISFQTIHRSKGLEQDYVIVINNDDSRTGFPNKIEDDSILSLVLSDKNYFEYSEERRLFYVALTRTKSYCYFLVDSSKSSIFIKEIEKKCKILNPKKVDNMDAPYCPYCKTGRLILRGEGINQFYGCSNFPYCEYHQTKSTVESSKRCPVCNHFIVWRDGSRGKFLGCSNYPICRKTFDPRYDNIERWKPTYKKYNKSN